MTSRLLTDADEKYRCQNWLTYIESSTKRCHQYQSILITWSNFEKVKNKTAKVKFVLQHFQTYGFYPNNFIKYAVHNAVRPDTDTSAQIRSLSSSGF